MLGIPGFAQVSPVGQYTEIVTKGQLGIDLIDTGCSCRIHFIILVPPGWQGLRATRWQDLKAKVCPVSHAQGRVWPPCRPVKVQSLPNLSASEDLWE